MIQTETHNDLLDSDEFLSYINFELDNYAEFAELFIDELQNETIQDYFAMEIFEPSDSVNFNFLDSVGVIFDGTKKEYIMELPTINSSYFKLNLVNFPAIINIYSIELCNYNNNNIIYQWNKHNNYKGVVRGVSYTIKL